MQNAAERTARARARATDACSSGRFSFSSKEAAAQSPLKQALYLKFYSSFFYTKSIFAVLFKRFLFVNGPSPALFFRVFFLSVPDGKNTVNSAQWRGENIICDARMLTD